MVQADPSRGNYYLRATSDDRSLTGHLLFHEGFGPAPRSRPPAPPVRPALANEDGSAALYWLGGSRTGPRRD